jgi:ADP-ribose pyrophosphatase YjhB (NUDIX family)
MIAGAFCIFLNGKNEVMLCLRQDKPLWNLPGGRVEESESPWDAAVREVKEEIAVDCTIDRLQGVYHKPAQDEVVFMFLAKIERGTPRHSDEVADIQYFPFDNLPENTAPMQKQRLEWFSHDRAAFLMKGH